MGASINLVFVLSYIIVQAQLISMCTSKHYFLSSCELINCSCISSHYRCYLLVLLYLSRLLTCTSLVVSGRCNSHKDSPLLNIALDNHRTQVLSVSLQSLVYWQKAKSDTTRPKSSQLFTSSAAVSLYVLQQLRTLGAYSVC